MSQHIIPLIYSIPKRMLDKVDFDFHHKVGMRRGSWYATLSNLSLTRRAPREPKSK